MVDAGLIVHRPGPLTTIQDLGRYGFFRQGLTVGGPADRLSFLWANRLCGNRAKTPVLEVTHGNALFEATANCQIAVAGGDSPIVINNRPVRNWCSHNLQPGDKLEIQPICLGTRVYLAVRGGLQIAKTFDSTATVTREKIGGLTGEALKKGDFLPILPCNRERDFYLPAGKRPDIFSPVNQVLLRMVPGWQYKQFPRALKRDLFTTTFTLSTDSNRMGVRLEGTPLKRDESLPAQMISEGIIAGVVQIPPDGLPIIMMQDHQTIGGYPKAGTVASPDLWRLAQLQPGGVIRFTPVSSCRARTITRMEMRQFEATLPEIA